jgi:hypothetical protein
MLCLQSSLFVITVMQEPLTILGRNHVSSVAMNGTGKVTTSILKPVSTRWPVLLCICINFCLQFRMLIQTILLSYISVRFKWTISQVYLFPARVSQNDNLTRMMQVARLMTIQPAVNLILFLTLPAILSATSHGASEQKRGFRVFRVLLLMLLFGDTILAAAPNIVLVTIGESNPSGIVQNGD